MHAEFTDKAIAHLTSIIDSHLEYCGERSAMKFSNQVDDKIKMLLKFPESGHLEPLLSFRKLPYRSKLINKRYKMIYYIDDETLWVAAIWDMRMHPKKLIKMI